MPRIVPSQAVQVIEKFFPAMKNQARLEITLDRGHRNECVSISKVVEQIPPELLNPPTIAEYASLLSNIAILNFTLESWKTPSHTNIDNLYSIGEGNPISIIHDILLKCPDEAISIKVVGLDFIDDIKLRDNLRLDLSSVNSALSNGEWKAVTVLSGSVTEALLLWAISKLTPLRQTDIQNAMQAYNIKEQDLNKWGLDWYNKVAKEIKLIQDRTFSQVDLAKEFRNYIHPGRSIRENAKCSAATAHAGIAAVELVIEDLSQYIF